jgi:hypothetical protein
MTQKQPDHNILEDAWDQVVGGMDWLKSVFFGEFADHRPLSAVVADMLVSFVPGVVIVTSARDAVAVVLRLANHPEKREELMEWVLLSACLIVIALPLAMAAGGAVAAGIGAIVGGIAGSELGAALRAVMLMLIKEAQKLVELVRFLQKFIKGDILKFLRAVKFAPYEKALMQAMSKITGKLLQIVKTLRTHLESLRYFDSVKATIATLAEWEGRFYAVQQDALKHMPKALAELDARLAKILAQTAPKEVHTVATGVEADKTVAALPAKQRIRDTPGKVLAKIDDKAPASVPKPKSVAKPKAKPKTKPKATPDAPPKDNPDPVKPADPGANTKKWDVADAAAAADKTRITQLSSEASGALKNGDKTLAKAKIDEARSILNPHLPKKPGDTWDEVLKRLDVSSPKDGAVFWSGDAKAAQKYAENINGVTLETTAGGRVIDTSDKEFEWEEMKRYAWDERDGASGPYAKKLWIGASENYGAGASGTVSTVQTPGKLWDPRTIWHNNEKDLVNDGLLTQRISEINMFTINKKGDFIPLSGNQVDDLLRLDGTRKPYPEVPSSIW